MPKLKSSSLNKNKSILFWNNKQNPLIFFTSTQSSQQPKYKQTESQQTKPSFFII